MGKIQVTLRKQAKQKWTSLGQALEFHNTFLRKKDRGKVPQYRHSETFQANSHISVWHQLKFKAHLLGHKHKILHLFLFYTRKHWLLLTGAKWQSFFFFTALYYRDCVLVSRTALNHNTYVFRLQLPCGTVMQVPVGKHIYLKALIDGEYQTTQIYLLSLIKVTTNDWFTQVN